MRINFFAQRNNDKSRMVLTGLNLTPSDYKSGPRPRRSKHLVKKVNKRGFRSFNMSVCTKQVWRQKQSTCNLEQKTILSKQDCMLSHNFMKWHLMLLTPVQTFTVFFFVFLLVLAWQSTISSVSLSLISANKTFRLNVTEIINRALNDYLSWLKSILQQRTSLFTSGKQLCN